MLRAGLLFGFLGLACGSASLEDAQGRLSPTQTAAVLLPDGLLLTPVFEGLSAWSATDLEFNPEVSGELWTTLRQFPMDAPCTQAVRTGCSALEGQVAIISGADSDAPSARIERDGNAWHFMRRPSSIAFGDNGNLATCGEARTGNFEDQEIDFHGPVLWSSDPTIFGARPLEGQNGTHLDMLHSTPWCMGIAHEEDNIYWAFNGQIGALDRYDFKLPHVIGGEDHADGEVLRYAEGALSRVPEVPSHLALDRQRDLLFVADTGNERVVQLNIQSGRPGAEIQEYDGMQVHHLMEDAELLTFVAEGELQLPSGVTLHESLVLVTDHASGKIHAFDSSGQAVRAVDTGLGAGALSGITVGPDGKAYLADMLEGRVYRIDSP